MSGTLAPDVEPTPDPFDDDRPAIATGRGFLFMAAIMGAAVWFGHPAIALLAAVILATAIVGRGWNALSLLGVHSERRLGRVRAFPGDRVELTMTVANRKPLPLAWVRAEERVPRTLLPDGSDSARPVIGFITPLRWYQSVTCRSLLNCRRRGYFTIGPTSLVSGDMFGLFAKRRQAGDEPTHLIVYPKLIAMSDLGLSSRHPLGDARDPSRLFEDANRPDGIRDYTPNTPFKAIAWTASARQGRLQAKTFEMTATLRVSLFLAVDSFPLQEVDDDLFEFAVSATASLAHRLLEDRHPVGLYVNAIMADGGGTVALAPGRGSDQARAMLEALAKLRQRASTPFVDLFDRNPDAFAGRATIAVVAASLSRSALDRLAHLADRGHAVTVLIAGAGPLPNGGFAARRLQIPGASP